MTEDILDKDNRTLHKDNVVCQCERCTKIKDQYVRFIDVNSFVDNLKDWD